jgi:hypothetical protein
LCDDHWSVRRKVTYKPARICDLRGAMTARIDP